MDFKPIPTVVIDLADSYSLAAHGGVIRASDGAVIPEDVGNADWRAYLAWVEAGNTAAPFVAPFDAPFDVGAVKAECGRRIYAIAGDAAQKNMTAANAAGLMDAPAQATYRAGVLWIAAMQQVSRALILAQDQTFADDSHWPPCPPDVVALAAQY